MYFTYVSQLPMLADNLELNSGKRLEFFDGYVRRAVPDQDGFRAYVFYDKFRSVSYRVTKDGLLIESYDGKKYHSSFVANTEGTFKYTPFAENAEDIHVNSFIILTNKMEKEYRRRSTFMGKLKRVTSDPIMIIFVAIGFLYAIVTAFVVISS